ncbi:hypothetical protein ABZ319_33110 [Nocardia sp. NPDC005978]|uniref:hypothetical protein n=1 Tax=Nocardia sp. NPDC005978 TaxID=3156725 RepID=UPI0033ADEE40
MNVALLVIGIVLAVLVVQLLWIVPVVLHFRRENERLDRELAASMAAETIIRPMERGSYRGSTVPGAPKVKNTGRIGLTARRLVFRTATSRLVEIPVSTMTGVRESKGFNGAVHGGTTHLVVTTSDGEYGFIVADPAEWTALLDGVVQRSR